LIVEEIRVAKLLKEILEMGGLVMNLLSLKANTMITLFALDVEG
jgi:hypothetical protein